MPSRPDKRFIPVDLSFNIGPAGYSPLAMPDCKDGGSVYCDGDTKPKCGGTSCEVKSGWRPGPFCSPVGTVVCDGRSFVGCQGVTLDRDTVFGDGLADCNPGGSIICEGTTKGCGSGSLTCVGSSCSGKSATRELGFEGRVMLDPGEFDELRAELAQVIAKFAR
jgi:hypothetical protein